MAGRVLVVGATGVIGSAVAAAFRAEGHEVVTAARKGADEVVDISDPTSVGALFERVGPLTAIVSCAGAARFIPLAESKDEDWAFSLSNKLMGQVNLVRSGAGNVADGGSITLTTGVLADSPMLGSSMISTVNAGLAGFVRAAALELPQLRINAVSPGWVAETLAQRGGDPANGIPAADAAQVYVRAAGSTQTGQVLTAQR